MTNKIKKGIYLHYKGNLYVVLTIATHTETHEEMVVYTSKDNSEKVWVRPASMFLDYAENHNGPIPRFRFIRSTNSAEST